MGWAIIRVALESECCRSPPDRGPLSLVPDCGRFFAKCRHDSVVGVCACKRVEPAGCKSSHRSGLNLLTEGNCVAARQGGEQPEVNDQSVG